MSQILGGGGGGGASGSLVVGTSAITSGTTKQFLYDNAGVLGETSTVLFDTTTGVRFFPVGSVSSQSTNEFRIAMNGALATAVWDTAGGTCMSIDYAGGDMRFVYNSAIAQMALHGTTGDLTIQGNLTSLGNNNTTLNEGGGAVQIGFAGTPNGGLDLRSSGNHVALITTSVANGVRLGFNATAATVLIDNGTKTFSFDVTGGGGNDLRLINNAATVPLTVVQSTNEIQIAQSITINSPTGGDKGTGTINVQGGIYLNGAAYTNPKWVLQHHYTGSVDESGDHAPPAPYAGLPSIDDAESFCRENHELPCMSMLSGKQDLFKGSDLHLASTEQLYLYIFELHRRLKELEQWPRSRN